jgi:hypothetical protein
MTISRYRRVWENDDPRALLEIDCASITQKELVSILNSDLYHTGRVTSLAIDSPCASGIVSKNILCYPAHLTKLSLTSLRNSLFKGNYTLTLVRELHYIHG